MTCSVERSGVVRLTMTAVPPPREDPSLPRLLHVVGVARNWLPFVALPVGLVLIPVTTALAVATLALGLVELFFRRFTRAMATLSPPPAVLDFTVVGPAMRTEATSLVTLQGVVLGLVFSFLGDRAVSPAVAVASVALVVGVLLGLLLLGLIAFGINERREAWVAAQLFLLSLSAAAYGLLCIAAATVFER
jgi:hypothetical protein